MGKENFYLWSKKNSEYLLDESTMILYQISKKRINKVKVNASTTNAIMMIVVPEGTFESPTPTGMPIINIPIKL